MARRADRVAEQKRRPAQVRPIKIPAKDMDMWEKRLVDHYKAVGGYSEDQVLQMAKDVLVEVQKGWPRAPFDIEKRIQRKTGWNSSVTSFIEPKETPKPKPVNPPKQHPSRYSSIRASLNEVEANWWDNSIQKYISEFEFNSSSDMPILEQIIVEEILQKRLAIEQLQNGETVNSILSKIMTESTKRLIELQESLGITRQQRSNEMNNIDGNVASIALSFEEKMDDILREEKEQIAEEERMQALKDAEPPINLLPPIDKLEGMLGLSEDDQLPQIQADDVAKIVEESEKIGSIKPLES